jgi:hypothetical protein
VHLTWRKLASLLMIAAMTLGVAACGDDDDDDVAASGDTEEPSGSASEDMADEDMAEGDEGDHPEEEGNPCGPDAPDDALPPAEEPADGATEVTITARDYEFEGAEALEAGGTFAITLENEGTELHEFALVRLADDEERPAEEIIASGEEPEMTDVAFGIACPGDSTTFNAEISEPGRYVAVCFVPVGTTPEATEEPEGPPHAAEGMFFEFEIS